MSMDYDEDDMKSGAMKKVAGMKAKNKMSKTAKVGKKMDKKEMMDAKRTPFLTKIMKKGDK